MKTFTFKVTVKEGNDEFWEELEETLYPAIHVQNLLREILEDAVLDVDIIPIKITEEY